MTHLCYSLLEIRGSYTVRFITSACRVNRESRVKDEYTYDLDALQ